MPLKNPKAKGSRRERQTIALFEQKAYQCTKAGGSLGVWDIIGIGPDDNVLIQVKSNRKPSKAEMHRMQAFQCGSQTRKLLVVWKDRVKRPLIEQIGAETYNPRAAAEQFKEAGLHIPAPLGLECLDQSARCKHNPHGDNCKAWPWADKPCRYCGSLIEDKGSCGCRS